MGYPFIKGRVFQAYFYDADMKFLERKKCLQYRKVTIPNEARWMNLEFNQPEVSDTPRARSARPREAGSCGSPISCLRLTFIFTTTC